LYELNRLREQVRKAQLFQPRKPLRTKRRMRTALSSGLPLKSTEDPPSASTGREQAAGQA
jgi:hypothetical protein